MAGVAKHEQKPKKAEIIQFPTPPEFAAERKQAQAEKAAEKLEREQAEQMGREILKAAREAGLTPEEAHAAVNKALTEARERKAAEDARNLELAREVQRKRAEQYLAGKTPEQYLKWMRRLRSCRGRLGRWRGSGSRMRRGGCGSRWGRGVNMSSGCWRKHRRSYCGCSRNGRWWSRR